MPDRGDIVDSYERIAREMVALRYRVEKLDLSIESKRKFYEPIDATLHECRIVLESLTGSFWWDPVQVRSRKAIGGY